MDIEGGLKKLRADTRPYNELERAIRVPAETLRDISEGITKNPRYDTLKKIANFYEREKRANGHKREARVA